MNHNKSNSLTGEGQFRETVRPKTPLGAGTPVSVDHLPSNVGSALKNLISLNVDSTKGWRVAADSVKDTSLKGRFTAFSQQRQQFADQLAGAVRIDGTMPDEDGSIAGSLHRWWLGVRADMSAVTPKAVLVEAERGEDSILKAYTSALKTDLPADLREIVQDQADEVKRVHDETKALRDAWKAST